MIDSETFKAYTVNAESYSNDWFNQPAPVDMYELLKKYFIVGGSTADIGCGNGRDCNWLSTEGFSVKGFDNSTELLQIAQKKFPTIEFRNASLPYLTEIDEKFDNILCETVIMHLDKSVIPTALDSLKNLLEPKGVIHLSWRVNIDNDQRHEDGRLYSAFESSFILDHFQGFSELHFEDKISLSSNKRVCRLVYQKN